LGAAFAGAYAAAAISPVTGDMLVSTDYLYQVFCAADCYGTPTATGIKSFSFEVEGVTYYAVRLRNKHGKGPS